MHICNPWNSLKSHYFRCSIVMQFMDLIVHRDEKSGLF